MSTYTELTKYHQELFRTVCQARLQIEFTDNQWATLTPFIQPVNSELQGAIEESAKAFSNTLISFNPNLDKPKRFQSYLNDFKENLAESDLLDVINITYDMMSDEQKGFMLDYVAKYTGYTFDPENIDKLFSTAPSDKAFTRMTSGNVDTYDRQFFTPFIWARLIGEDAPDMFELDDKIAKIKIRIENEGPAMFDKLFDYRAVYRVVHGR